MGDHTNHVAASTELQRGGGSCSKADGSAAPTAHRCRCYCIAQRKMRAAATASGRPEARRLSTPPAPAFPRAARRTDRLQ